MTQRHKHADTIIAWANGAKIQVKVHDGSNGWKDCNALGPEWHEYNEYRIKPEPKPDCRVPLRLARLEGGGFILSDRGPDNFIATFDGEMGNLKSVEILK